MDQECSESSSKPKKVRMVELQVVSKKSRNRKPKLKRQCVTRSRAIDPEENLGIAGDGEQGPRERRKVVYFITFFAGLLLFFAVFLVTATLRYSTQLHSSNSSWEFSNTTTETPI